VIGLLLSACAPAARLAPAPHAAAGEPERPRGEGAVPGDERGVGDARPGASGPLRDRPDDPAPGGAIGSLDEPEEPSDEDDAPADDGEVEPPPDATVLPPHPLAHLSDEEFAARVKSAPESLGSMSVGRPSAGRLLNAVRLEEGPGLTVVAPGSAWATEETARALDRVLAVVAARHPGTPRLPVGDVSARPGGPLAPHLSHQSGRDVDIGYYHRDGVRWYRRATPENLDLDRQWTLSRALVTETDVEMILMDATLLRALREHAASRGESAEWLELLFRGRGGLPPLFRHAPGHATHVHVRFYSPVAQETGRRAFPTLIALGKIPVGPVFVTHVARKGDTLERIARRYGTTVRAIRRANGLGSTLIQAKKSYRIPLRRSAPPGVVAGPVRIPPRRLPPP